ncbi:hypothetical protein GCM10023085_32230 [Actinomadura viridis]
MVQAVEVASRQKPDSTLIPYLATSAPCPTPGPLDLLADRLRRHADVGIRPAVDPSGERCLKITAWGLDAPVYVIVRTPRNKGARARRKAAQRRRPFSPTWFYLVVPQTSDSPPHRWPIGPASNPKQTARRVIRGLRTARRRLKKERRQRSRVRRGYMW